MNTRQFYITRKNEMIALRENGHSDTYIAKKFNISRERVGQIIGRANFLYKEYRDKIIAKNTNKSNTELGKIFGLSGHTVADIRGKTLHKLDKKEYPFRLWLQQHLQSLGFPVQLLPYHSKYNALVNNYKVSIKIAFNHKTSPSIKNINPMYRFRVNKEIDFHIFIIANTKDIFIIPDRDVPSNLLYLYITFPTSRPGIMKWQKYHNRIDLLQLPFPHISTPFI